MTVPQAIKDLLKAQLIIQILVVFGSTLLVARLYGSTEVGEFNLVVLWAGLFVPLIGLSSEFLVLDKDERHNARNLLIWIIPLQIPILPILFLASCGSGLLEQEYFWLSYPIALSLFFYEFVRSKAISLKRLDVVAKVDVSLAFFSVLLKVLFWFVGGSSLNLVCAQIIASFGCACLYFLMIEGLLLREPLVVRSMFNAVKAVFLVKAPQLFLSRGGALLVPLAISSVVGVQAVALYTLARGVVLLPGRMFSRVLTDYFSAGVNVSISEKNKLLGISTLLMIFGAAISFLVKFIPEDFYVRLLGKSWFGLSIYLPPLIVWASSIVASSAWLGIANARLDHTVLLKVEIIHLVIRAAACTAFFIDFFSLSVFLWAVSFLGFVVNLSLVITYYVRTS